MTVEALHGLGFDDATLEREFLRMYGYRVDVLQGNGDTATARRREVFDACAARWYV